MAFLIMIETKGVITEPRIFVGRKVVKGSVDGNKVIFPYKPKKKATITYRLDGTLVAYNPEANP